MRTRIAFVALLLVTVLVTAVHAQSGDEATGQQLQKLEQQWAEAAKKQDAGPLEALLAADYTLTNPVGQVVPKSVFVEKLKDGSFKIEAIEYKNMKVRVYGETAVVIGRLTMKGTWEGSDVSGDYAFTDTFVKQSGKWQEIAGQVTRVEE